MTGVGAEKEPMTGVQPQSEAVEIIVAPAKEDKEKKEKEKEKGGKNVGVDEPLLNQTLDHTIEDDNEEVPPSPMATNSNNKEGIQVQDSVNPSGFIQAESTRLSQETDQPEADDNQEPQDYQPSDTQDEPRMPTITNVRGADMMVEIKADFYEQVMEQPESEDERSSNDPEQANDPDGSSTSDINDNSGDNCDNCEINKLKLKSVEKSNVDLLKDCVQLKKQVKGGKKLVETKEATIETLLEKGKNLEKELEHQKIVYDQEIEEKENEANRQRLEAEEKYTELERKYQLAIEELQRKNHQIKALEDEKKMSQVKHKQEIKKVNERCDTLQEENMQMDEACEAFAKCLNSIRNKRSLDPENPVESVCQSDKSDKAKRPRLQSLQNIHKTPRKNMTI